VTTGSEELEVRPNTRRTLVRMAVLYVPLAIACVAVALYSFSHFLGGATGAIVPAFFVGIFAFAFTVEGLAAVRDLRSAGPVTSQGMVRRTWSRGGLLWFFRSHYMFAGDTVYTVEPLTSVTVRTGDTVEVDHWPYTKTVVAVRLLSHGSGVVDPDARPTYR
jgi:hypothetical protein